MRFVLPIFILVVFWSQTSFVMNTEVDGRTFPVAVSGAQAMQGMLSSPTLQEPNENRILAVARIASSIILFGAVGSAVLGAIGFAKPLKSVAFGGMVTAGLAIMLALGVVLIFAFGEEPRVELARGAWMSFLGAVLLIINGFSLSISQRAVQ